jgi:hypothetical protein
MNELRLSRAERKRQDENMAYLQQSRSEVIKCQETQLALIDEKIAESASNKTPVLLRDSRRTYQGSDH